MFGKLPNINVWNSKLITLKQKTRIEFTLQTLLIACLLLLASLPERGPTLASFGPINLKLLHLALLFIALVNIKQIRIIYPLRPLVFQMMFFVLWSVPFIFVYGLDPIVLNYLLGAAALIVLSSALRFKQIAVISGLQLGAALIALSTVAVIVVNLEQYNLAISTGISTGARPLIEGPFFSGGINLIATWIALFAVFFIKSKRLFVGYFLIAALVQFYYMSRAGTLALFIVLIFAIYSNWKFIKSKFSPKFLWLFIPIILIILGVLLFFSGLGNRFLLIGNEPGSSSRVSLWEAAWRVISQNLFTGMGLGNELKILLSYGNYAEGNLHNATLNAFMAAGILGIVIYFVTTVQTFIRLRNWIEPLALFVGYFIISQLECRGAETPFLIPLGLLIGAAYWDKLLQRKSDEGSTDVVNLK